MGSRVGACGVGRCRSQGLGSVGRFRASGCGIRDSGQWDSGVQESGLAGIAALSTLSVQLFKGRDATAQEQSYTMGMAVNRFQP